MCQPCRVQVPGSWPFIDDRMIRRTEEICKSCQREQSRRGQNMPYLNRVLHLMRCISHGDESEYVFLSFMCIAFINCTIEPPGTPISLSCTGGGGARFEYDLVRLVGQMRKLAVVRPRTMELELALNFYKFRTLGSHHEREVFCDTERCNEKWRFSIARTQHLSDPK